MVVLFVLQSAYTSVQGRLNFILQAMSFANRNSSLIVVNEYYKDHFEKLINGTSDRFYNELEMDRLSVEEIEKLSFCYVPDVIFDEAKEKAGSRTKMLADFSENDIPALTEFLIESIKNELISKNENIEYLMCNVETMASMRTVAQHFNAPLIPYLFAPIKKVHGYAVTLYNSHIGESIFSTLYAKQGFKDFHPEQLEFDLLDNKEILALLGKRKNVVLLPLVEGEGVWDVGVAAQGDALIPQTFIKKWVTDEDIYFDAERMFGADRIQTRLHPNKMIRIGLGKKHYKNDPVAFILSSKRLAMVQSQVSLKAALWNRPVCAYAKALPYSFAFSHDLESADRISIELLNYIVFGYLVPSKLMFDKGYWRWRITNPTSNEIYLRHLTYILEELGIDQNILFKGSRLKNILEERRYSSHEIEQATSEIKEEDIDYNFLSSRLALIGNNNERDIYCVNVVFNDYIRSKFIFSNCEEINRVRFYPFDDVDGYAFIREIKVNDRAIQSTDTENRYLKKNQFLIELPLEKTEHLNQNVEIIWHGTTFFNNF